MHKVSEWTRPDSYFGAEWHGWFSAGFGQSRDSDALEQSNFQTAYDALKGLATDITDAPVGMFGREAEHTTVQIVSENHWAVGWVEWIAIHKTNVAALAMARELCDRANNYPILDEEDFSRREDEECTQVWEKCFTVSDRVHYLRHHSYTTTSFADLLQATRGGSWYHAANMLHCPTDLLY